MSEEITRQPVMELRVAMTTSQYQSLVRFYCEGLGVAPAAVWDSEDSHGRMLMLGNASLEIFDEAQAAMVDQLEAGQRVSGQIRFALKVPDLQAAMERLLAHGAKLIHPPIETPWGSLNVRLEDPDGMQITLFQSK